MRRWIRIINSITQIHTLNKQFIWQLKEDSQTPETQDSHISDVNIVLNSQQAAYEPTDPDKCKISNIVSTPDTNTDRWGPNIDTHIFSLEG